MTAAAERALDDLSAKIVDVPLTVGTPPETLTILLRHFVDRPEHPVGAAPLGHRAVLLIHGGNTSSETFLVPHGGVATYLRERGWDVWLVDDRASPRVLDDRILGGQPLGGSVEAERRYFNFDRIAEEDVVGAIAHIRNLLGPRATLSVVGHCVGGATTSMAIARGRLDKFAVQAYVLTTMGLFFESPWDGWVKAEDYVIERVLSTTPGCRGIDPVQLRPPVLEASRRAARPWPAEFDEAYGAFPAAWLPPVSDVPEDDMLRRLSFMFGSPYDTAALDPSLRGSILCRLFGTMHLGLYLHAGQVVRRGYAGRFDAPDIIERPRLESPPRARHARRAAPRGPKPAHPPEGDLLPQHFRDKRITLLTGTENRLWHRESIDLMYEWLRNIEGRPASARVEKRIFPGFAHQDLYWRREEGDRDVYAAIAASLV
ncbi:MAG TPA: hypothetical protein VH062_34615 [Polyangiaceae bacterium]|jgi:hypothetical protein|nr:hypothetical protein [Polyangiaceae bacterium]